MGTRHLICVVLGGEYRVAQYGQWDGYPCGQGKDVHEFLKTADLDAFRKQVAKVRAPKESELGEWTSTNRHLSRDTGAGILDYVLSADDPFVRLYLDFAGDSLFCEWAYVIDLDKNTLEVFKGFNKDPLADGERFLLVPRHKRPDGTLSEYHQVKLVKAWGLSAIPDDAMEALEKELSDADEDAGQS